MNLGAEMAMQARQPNITLGTAGHVDHGKTALVRCLTGCETDTLKEEKERGMSIELGFAPCMIEDGQVGIVDVPGHEDFIKTMVAGACGMDGVIFVVAADDGVMPQTREHLEILTLLGIRHGIVALTKSDRVSPDDLELAKEDVRTLLSGTFLQAAPILPISNTTGAGFDAFLTALQDLVRSIQPRRTDGLFRMPIERVFSVTGYGTVVSGIPISGSAKVGDDIVLLPQGTTGRIRAIQVYKNASDRVLAGQCSALNVPQLEHKDIVRGNVLAVPGSFSAAQWYTCKVQLLPHSGLLLKNAAEVRFHTGTAGVMATVYLPQGSAISAGESQVVQFHMAEPVIAGPGDRFIVRSLSPVQTIGGGIVIQSDERRHKRNKPEIIQDLAEHAAAVPNERAHVEYCLRSAAGAVATTEQLAGRAKMPTKYVAEILADLARQGTAIALPGSMYAHSQSIRRIEQQILAIVRNFHLQSPQSPGIAAEDLRQASQVDARLFQTVMSGMKGQGTLVELAGRICLPTHSPSLSKEDEALMQQVEAAFLRNPLAPPGYQEVLASVREPADRIDKALKLLLQHQRLVRIDKELVFHAQAIDKARQILIAFLQKEGKMESVRFKYLLDTSRKYAIPLLDYFDRIGLTRQVNHTRYLRSGVRPGAS